MQGNRNGRDVNATVDTQHPRPIRRRTSARATAFDEIERQAQPVPLMSKDGELPLDDVLEHIARLEASTGAALALLRRCIVEDKSPTREALAAEAGFVFEMPCEAALAEMDDVAQMMGISSLR
jgi:hypothetical protein